MKKIIIAVLVMLIGIIVSGQEKQTNPPETKDFYLQKAKKQNTAAWVLLGGGAVLVAGGAILFGENFELFTNETNAGESGGLIMVAAGGLAMLGSIPFFISSSSNRRKAQTAPVAFNFKMEKRIDPWRQWKQTYYPAVSIKFNLK